MLIALDNPALARRVAEDIRRSLADLMGERRLEFIRSASEAPRMPTTIRETTERIVESGAMNDIFEQLHDAPDKAPVTPVDAMFQSRDSELVAHVLNGWDEAINTLR